MNVKKKFSAPLLMARYIGDSNIKPLKQVISVRGDNRERIIANVFASASVFYALNDQGIIAGLQASRLEIDRNRV